LIAAVDFSGAGGDFGLCKLLYRIAQGVDVFTELKIESWQVHFASPLAYLIAN
jgi:hypothetical protein